MLKKEKKQQCTAELNVVIEKEGQNLKKIGSFFLDYSLPPNKNFGVVYHDFTFIQFRFFRMGSSVLWDIMLYS